ncbi:H-type ferritin FtnA [Staphylococcus aureus]
MLSKNLLEALNDQMNHEYFAAHAYMAMAYCDKESYEGFANFFIQQAKEERFHGQKIYNYLTTEVHMQNSEQFQHQKLTFQAYKKLFKDSLSQEQEVTRRFYNLSEIARQDKDYATISFLNSLLDEQVEEESMFETHINYLTRIGDDSNALYLYEKELGARTFDEDN